MGGPLFRMLHETGHQVIGIDTDPEALARVERYVQTAGQATPDTCTLSGRLDPLSGADLIIEAVPEDMAVKSELLYRLGTLCPEHTGLVTTTAMLSLVHLAIASGRPARTVGLRMLLPPQPGAGVEPTGTTMSDDSAVETLNEVTAAAGLRHVVMGARPSTNAITLMYAYLNRAVAPPPC